VTHNLVGIIRTGAELKEAIAKIADIRKRSANVAVTGGRKFNPGFHLAFDLDNMLLVAESTAKSADAREESRGGHTHVMTSQEWIVSGVRSTIFPHLMVRR
jgi:succinate dehydrogenase / fumarate reductase flavoprotein subunit